MDIALIAAGFAAGLALEWFLGPIAWLKARGAGPKTQDGPSNPPPPPKA